MSLSGLCGRLFRQRLYPKDSPSPQLTASFQHHFLFCIHSLNSLCQKDLTLSKNTIYRVISLTKTYILVYGKEVSSKMWEKTYELYCLSQKQGTKQKAHHHLQAMPTPQVLFRIPEASSIRITCKELEEQLWPTKW